MDWRIKAFVQKILSKSRIGDKLNHLNVLLNSKYHENKLKYHFYECFRKYDYCKFDLSKKNLTALEIGTGYSIIEPILLSLIGFDKIVTLDIDSDIYLKSLKKQIRYLKETSLLNHLISKSIYDSKYIKERIKFIETSKSLQPILNELNIIYIAPYKIDDIKKVCNSFDYIFSQVVFEHINPSVLNELFGYFNTSLKSSGYCVHTINFVDHFTNEGFFMDTKISEFNYLKFSDKYWKYWAGNNITYINRLSYKYYLDLCKTYDFELLEFIGENYKESIKFNLNLIHNDILKKYDSQFDKEELVKYQRGTIIFQKQKEVL